MVDRQLFVNRVTDKSALSPGEFAQGHIDVNAGGSLKFLLRRFPGEYLAGGPSFQVGLGLRL